MLEVDLQVRQTLIDRVRALETHFGADVIFLYGPIYPSIEKGFREFIEKLKSDGVEGGPRQRLAIFLNTPGGSAEIVEKLVEIIRFNYKEVYFVIPDEAMSAGTIFCMAGDKIFMDYTSSLGPIDPQVHNGKDWVPALGYLDQVEKMIQKSAEGTITDAELIILQNQDLAMLSRYQQAKNLTITLLKKWLVEYKFKDWTVHQTNKSLLGTPVTHDEKEQRAKDIAACLSDNQRWHSHGRMISAKTLSADLRLKIDDYSTDTTLRPLIRQYNDLITDYIEKNGYRTFLHSRCHF